METSSKNGGKIGGNFFVLYFMNSQNRVNPKTTGGFDCIASPVLSPVKQTQYILYIYISTRRYLAQAFSDLTDKLHPFTPSCALCSSDVVLQEVYPRVGSAGCNPVCGHFQPLLPTSTLFPALYTVLSPNTNIGTKAPKNYKNILF